jgi:FkbM family methyltransferase
MVLRATVAQVIRFLFRKMRLILSKNYEGHKVYFDPSTDIGWMLLINKKFEKEEIEICKKIINENSVVLDVGANIGLLSISFAKKAVKGLVIAVEASPTTFVQLLRNTRGLPNIVNLNVGFSSESGIAEFFVASDDAYSGLKNTERKDLVESIKIPCFRGAEIIQPILPGPVDLIKIDVEGLETEVIEGLESLIHSSRPVVFCEIYRGEASNPDVLQTISTMEKMSYSTFVSVGSTLQKFVEHDDHFYNYFFIPAEKMEQFRKMLNIV